MDNNLENNELYQRILKEQQDDMILEEQAKEIKWIEIAKYIYYNIYRPIYDTCNNTKVKATINKLIQGMKELTEEETTTTEFMYIRKLYLSDKEQLFEVMQDCLYYEAQVKLPKEKPTQLKKPQQDKLDKILEELKQLEKLGIIDKSVINTFIAKTK